MKKTRKNQKISLSLEMCNFFGNCPVMLWKKTKVLCKRHVMTRCISMLRNSRWDKLKWHLCLRWRLHVKLAGIISPHSENSTLRFPLDCSIFGWNERDSPHSPSQAAQGTVLCPLLPTPPRASGAQKQQDARSRWTRMRTGSRDTGCNKRRNEIVLHKFLERPYCAAE